MKKAARRKTKIDSMEVDDEGETHNNKNTTSSNDKPEATSPTTTTSTCGQEGTVKVPVLFQLHGHQGKRTGSFDTTSSSSPTSMIMATADHNNTQTTTTLLNNNNNDNDTTNIMWLKPGENWLRLLPRTSHEKNSILDDTQDTFSMAAARYMPIPQILSARDYGYDMSQLLLSSSSTVKAAEGSDNNHNNNNDCVFLVVDVDEGPVRRSADDSSAQQQQQPPRFQLAIKDMRFPVPQNTNHNKTEQNNASMMPPAFELCLARRTSTSPSLDEPPPPQQLQVDKKDEAEDHFWAGYTALERLPRRQLRILQVGDRLCTRIVTSRASSPTAEASAAADGYDFGDTRNNEEEEEGDFSGVGLVLEYRWEDQVLSAKEEDDEEEEEDDEEEDGDKCHPSQPISSPLMSQEEELQTQFTVTKDDDDDNHLDNDEKVHDDNDDDSATTVGENDEEGIMTQMQTDDCPPLGQPSDESPVAGSHNDDNSNNDNKEDDDDIILHDGDGEDKEGTTDKKDQAVVLENLLITQPEETDNQDDKDKSNKKSDDNNGNDSDDSDATIGEENVKEDDKPPAEVAVIQDADKTAGNGGDSENKLDDAEGDGKETSCTGGDPSKEVGDDDDDDDDDTTTIGSAQYEPEKESGEKKDGDKAVSAPSAAVIDSQATETEEEEQAKQPVSSDNKETPDEAKTAKTDSEKNQTKNNVKEIQQNDGDNDDDTTVNDGDDATQDLAAEAEAEDTKVESGGKQSQSSNEEPPKKTAKKETPKRKAGKKGKGKKDENESLEDRLPESVKEGLKGATAVFRLEDDDDEDITEPGESPPRRTVRNSRSTRQGSQKEADVPMSEEGPFFTADTDITSPTREYETYGYRRRGSPRASGGSQKKDPIIMNEIDVGINPEASTKEEEAKDEKESTDKGKSDNVDDTSKGESQPITGNDSDSDSKDGIDGEKATAPRSRQTRAKRNISELAEEEGKEDKKISSENKSAKIKENEEKLALPKSKAKKSRVSKVKKNRSIEVDEDEEAEFDKIVPMSNSRSSPTGSESSDPAAVGRQKRRKREELSPKASQGKPPVDGGGEPGEVDQGTSKPSVTSADQPPGKGGGEGLAKGPDETPPAEEETAIDNAGGGDSTAKDSEESPSQNEKKTRPKRGQKSAKTESNSSTDNAEETPSRSSTRKRKPVAETPEVTEGKRTRVGARATTRTPRKAEAEVKDTEETNDAGKRTRVSARSTRTPRKAKAEEEDTVETENAVRIITTGVRPLSKQELSNAKRLGWEVLDDIQDSPHATHIIAGEKGVSMRRTPKLMVGICCTPNIVSLDWLLQSLKAKKALPVENFLLVNDTIAERKYKFSLQDSLERAKTLRESETKLFQGWHIHACKGVAGNKAPPENELKLIVEQIGAIWTPALNKKTLDGVDLSHLLVITSDPEQKKQVSAKAVADAIKGGARKQTTSWLFGCIIRVEIPP